MDREVGLCGRCQRLAAAQMSYLFFGNTSIVPCTHRSLELHLLWCFKSDSDVMNVNRYIAIYNVGSCTRLTVWSPGCPELYERVLYEGAMAQEVKVYDTLIWYQLSSFTDAALRYVLDSDYSHELTCCPTQYKTHPLYLLSFKNNILYITLWLCII